ncbi:caratenoid biosynthesis protein [Nocardia donostiensis]|uniref:Caratenoid biosynthesis protein n=2 Tax=Nocardia donostiensis TaxID=1538463 RepID=A0A1W0B7Q0_9NOCA|nr:carotenoid biosynthesis protein [Nocardia donostiensis]ONM46006.1 caratenoid biosynthesis protein [Nocardia donostiensis]OQS12387.1 caratenoid biosynthesis protein [Nocardia donostiensis]OQS18537.1 caratenoid biosynthesis protein [Nocardia donostiensis]
MLWILAQIAYPLVTGAARDQVTVVVVLLAAGTALAHAAAVRGAAYALGFLVIVSGLGLLSEIAGTATGIPYGCYSYALDRLGPALADVPLVVPLAWTGGIYPIWVIAGLLVRRPAVRMVVLAAGAVGWDLFLDPQMVADGQWAWCVTDTGLPGMSHIPYTNYLGWFAVALVMAGLLTVWERVAPGDASDGPVGVAVAMFLWTWLGSMLAHAVFLGLPVSAVYGGLGLAWLGVGLLIRLVRGGNERIRFR